MPPEPPLLIGAVPAAPELLPPLPDALVAAVPDEPAAPDALEGAPALAIRELLEVPHATKPMTEIRESNGRQCGALGMESTFIGVGDRTIECAQHAVTLWHRGDVAEHEHVVLVVPVTGLFDRNEVVVGHGRPARILERVSLEAVHICR